MCLKVFSTLLLWRDDQGMINGFPAVCAHVALDNSNKLYRHTLQYESTMTIKMIVDLWCEALRNAPVDNVHGVLASSTGIVANGSL